MKLSIPKPCHENWNEMSQTEQGRFCSVCSKTVMDFTDCSYEEIYQKLSNDKNICGRFKSNQLNVNLRFLALKSFALGLLMAGTTSLYSQELKGEELNKIDFKEGIFSISKVNPKVHYAMFLGMPTDEDIENASPLIYLDGKKIKEEKMMKLKRDEVESVNILHGNEASEKYGKRGEKYGVILITARKK